MFIKKVLIWALLVGFAGFGLSALAVGEAGAHLEEKYVIALKTDDFELEETDVSDLAIGESETIVTENGKTIDILRTEEGLELYVDGVLQELNFSEPLHGEHPGLHKEIEIICSDDDDCDEMVWVSGDDGEFAAAGDKHVFKHEIVVECSDDSDCSEENIWITEDGENVNLEEADGEVHVIRLHEGSEDPATSDHHEKVIMIKRKTTHD